MAKILTGSHDGVLIDGEIKNWSLVTMPRDKRKDYVVSISERNISISIFENSKFDILMTTAELYHYYTSIAVIARYLLIFVEKTTVLVAIMANTETRIYYCKDPLSEIPNATHVKHHLLLIPSPNRCDNIDEAPQISRVVVDDVQLWPPEPALPTSIATLKDLSSFLTRHMQCSKANIEFVMENDSYYFDEDGFVNAIPEYFYSTSGVDFFILYEKQNEKVRK